MDSVHRPARSALCRARAEDSSVRTVPIVVHAVRACSTGQVRAQGCASASQCGQFVDHAVQQVPVVAVRARRRQPGTVERDREPIDDAARVESIQRCIPFGQRCREAGMHVEMTAPPRGVPYALPQQLLWIGNRQQHHIRESETTLSEHPPDCREFVLESRDRCHAHRGQAPAVMQLQRITIAHSNTSGSFQDQRRDHRCALTCAQ